MSEEIDRRDFHHALIDAYTEALNTSMKEKSDANDHKPPLCDEPWKALWNGMNAEFYEIPTEVYRVRRFGADPRAVFLEFADLNNYGAEINRRLGVLPLAGTRAIL